MDTKFLKIILTKGIPASSKSTWAKAEVAKDPSNWIRINNDDLRASLNGSVFTTDSERFITETRNFLIKEGLKRNRNIIVDNVNSNKRHWEMCCKLAKEANKNVFVTEKPFYIEVEEAIERDSKREAKVGEAVIRKFWKDLGGKQFKFYNAKSETFYKRTSPADNYIPPMIQDESLPRAVIFDNDGTISLLNGRNPYDASTCDQDLPHAHVIECMRNYFKLGYKIIFVSGREEKDRAPTERFYKKHFPEITYDLFMRPTGNSENDVIIKERIFNQEIKDKYFVAGWFDDRQKVCKWVYDNGLGLFRVNDPLASF